MQILAFRFGANCAGAHAQTGYQLPCKSDRLVFSHSHCCFYDCVCGEWMHTARTGSLLLLTEKYNKRSEKTHTVGLYVCASVCVCAGEKAAAGSQRVRQRAPEGESDEDGGGGGGGSRRRSGGGNGSNSSSADRRRGSSGRRRRKNEPLRVNPMRERFSSTRGNKLCFIPQ